MKQFSFAGSPLIVSEGQGDGGLFNGIYIRYAVDLARYGHAKATYRNLIRANARNAWQYDRTPTGIFADNWASGMAPDKALNIDLSTALSGVFLLNTAALMARGMVGE